MAIGPNGELYMGGTGTVFSVVIHSLDASDRNVTPTFTAVLVGLGGSFVREFLGPNPGGVLGQANVAADRSSGPTAGNVYLLGSVQPFSGPDKLELHFVRSTDGGMSWSSPKRVNDDDPAGNAWQWFAAMSVAPNGRIDVIWNDTRGSEAVNISQLFYAYSMDAGVTWSGNVPVSPAFDSHLGYPQQQKIGDYYDIVSDATGARVAYAATFHGEQDIYYVRVFPDCNQNGVLDDADISAGTSPDCNANQIPDECDPSATCYGPGAIPPDPGAGLTVSHGPSDFLVLSWGDSCNPEDSDFAIYQGTIGNFGGQAARFCTTGGETEKTFSPISGSTYYLVVPTQSGLEGSYGLDGEGNERLPGQNPCLPQRIQTCPASSN
jgi:hypothetical protein